MIQQHALRPGLIQQHVSDMMQQHALRPGLIQQHVSDMMQQHALRPGLRAGPDFGAAAINADNGSNILT